MPGALQAKEVVASHALPVHFSLVKPVCSVDGQHVPPPGPGPSGAQPSAALRAEEGVGGGHLVTEGVMAVPSPLLQLSRLLFPGLRYSWLSFPVNSITLSLLRSLTQDDDAY